MFRAFVVLVLLTASVAAQPSAESTKLFEEGRELAKLQKWAEACEKFQKSLAVDPGPGTKLNLGDCLEKQGKIRSGWLMFEEAARDFERASDPRAKFAHERAAAASAKLATLVIKVADPRRAGLAIRIGDRAATPQAEIVERVDPGPLTVTATAPDAAPQTTEVTAVAGKTSVVDVPVLADQRVTAPPTQRDEPMTPSSGARRKRMLVAITLTSVGGAALIGGVTLGFLAKAQYDGAFDDEECFTQDVGPDVCTPDGKADVDSARTKADIGTGFGLAGVALVAAGAIVYLTAPKEHDVTVAPVASSSSVGVMLGGRF